jgi:S1-C subfamily serine protease
VRGPVRLAVGQICAECRARRAWEQADGQKMVITKGAIDAAVEQRKGEAAGEPLVKRALAWAPTVAGFVLSAIGVLFLWRTLQPRALGPLQEVFGGLQSDARLATLLGGAAAIHALVAIVIMKRGRHYRRIAMIVPTLLALCGGLSAAGVGGLHWLGMRFPVEHLTMPKRTALVEPSPVVDRIMDATCVVVAPGADGDARSAALGTAQIIAAKGDRVWILTNSHVAMPYAAVGAWRRASEAQPVWVQLSDGRSTIAKVVWTARPPLDVAVIEAPFADAPKPIEISPDSEALVAGSPVMFVPNPYREGWLVHRGVVQKREEHDTPAGLYSLLYTDLPVVPGDSGSGLYDAQGRLVGLNTWTRMGDGTAPQGISLPSEAMRAIVDAIAKDKLDSLDEKLGEDRERSP